MSFSAFAENSDETVLDGYHIDNVPYNSNIDTVLTASDSGSQYYISTENKTYKTSSALSAPSVDTESVYHFKSITDFIPWNIWRGSNSPVITNPQKNGYTGVKYVWESNPPAQNFYHYNSMKPFSNLRPTRKYRISFTFNLSRTNGTFQFYLADKSSPDVAILYLLKITGNNGSAYMGATNLKYTIEFAMPNDNVTIVPVVKGTLAPTGSVYSGTETEFYINDFTITDITTEDLDNSLGKLGDRIQGFFNNLIESIKGFFIPEEGFFNTVKQKFESLLSEHLGFLYEAPEMVGTIFNVVKDWNPPEEPTITLPAFDFDIGDDHIHLWDEQVYTFDFLANQPWSTLYAFYKTFIFVLLSVAMINLAIKKYHSIIGGGESDDN